MVFDSHQFAGTDQKMINQEKTEEQLQQVTENKKDAETLVRQSQDIFKKPYSIKDFAKHSASQNVSIDDNSEKAPDCSPGYEHCAQENEDEIRIFEEESQRDEEEDAHDDKEEDPEDDEDTPKEDITAPVHEVKIQKVGDKILHAEFSKGLKHGVTSIKTKEGHYEMQAHYVKDKLDGPTTYYYPDGKIEREINFQQGEMHGLMKSFHEDGKTAMEIEYERGIMHGMSKIYDEFGNNQIFSTYKKGKLHGEMIIFSNGKPYLKKIYHEGRETHQQHDPEAAHSC
jgi:antitoxin component YwqK of YwqJK toxin-antitoxin module